VTADTPVSVEKDDTILIFIKGAFFAAFNAGGIITMVAHTGQEELADMRIAAGLICLNPASEYSIGNFILGFTGYLTCKTADTPVDINKHGIFFFLFCHFFNVPVSNCKINIMFLIIKDTKNDSRFSKTMQRLNLRFWRFNLNSGQYIRMQILT
jgi:hypothetical protein